MEMVTKELIVSGNRKELRRNVIEIFLDEEPGIGKGENSSKYKYNVETLANGDRVYLRRPAPLNKGMDFEVHVENIRFTQRGRVHMPSHKHIIEDLTNKKNENADEYKKIKNIINKLYNCSEVKEEEYNGINVNVGHPIESILKALKWLFIEQDVTYWNWSGRAMLYSKLQQENLC